MEFHNIPIMNEPMQVGGQNGLVHRGQMFGQLFAGRTFVGAEVGDDLLDVFGEVRNGVEPVQLDRRDVGHAFFVFEEVQPGFHEVGTQFVHGANREAALSFPRVAHEFEQPPVFELAGHDAGQFHVRDGRDDFVEVRLTDVFLQFAAVGKDFRLGIEEAGVFGDFALGLDPRLDGFRIVDGFHARFETLERHVREPLLMMAHQPGLVLVVIRRAEPFAGQTAAIHKLEIALRWINRLVLPGEHLVHALPERVPDRFFLGDKHAAGQ